MKKMSIALLLLCAALLPTVVLAQAKAAATPPARPFQNGPVWILTFVHTKPGLGLKYMEYLATEWKKSQEALKKAGLILDYKVIGTDAHSPNDWDLMLMVEYKDLATLEANEDKADAMLQKMFGTDEKVMQGYKERSEIREVLGTRLAREIILEPKK